MWVPFSLFMVLKKKVAIFQVPLLDAKNTINLFYLTFKFLIFIYTTFNKNVDTMNRHY